MKKQNAVNVSENDIVFDGKYWIDRNGVRRRFVDPTDDEGFKVLLGREGCEELLMGLLNRVIPGVDIVGLTYKNTEQHGIFVEDGKAVFDVYCEDSNGVRFLVEMQNWNQRYFNKRAVYYSTFAIQEQARKEKKHQLCTLEKDKWDYSYAPVYVVCILNFNMQRKHSGLEKLKENEYLSIYRYRDLETGEDLGDGTTLVFVELKKLNKRMDECSDPRERVLCAIRNMSSQLEIPEDIADDPLLMGLYKKAELAALPSEMRLTYISHIMNRNDMLNSIAEQLEDAREEERAKNAKNLRNLGVDPEIIAKATGLTVEEIQNV